MLTGNMFFDILLPEKLVKTNWKNIVYRENTMNDAKKM